jgi:hypothetical protein
MNSVRKVVLFFKAHVKQYVRKDGTVVKEHDTSRQAPAKDWRDEENWHSRTMGRMKTLGESELRFIIKDATEAAEIGEKSGWSEKKTGQYRDEAHYAAMELHKRGQGLREAKARYDAEKKAG